MPVASEWLEYAPKPRELGAADRWNVFLSYRSVNRAWVINLYDVLREIGHKVFLDQTALKPGDQLIDVLQDALGTSQAGVLIWSAATGDSSWVTREYQDAGAVGGGSNRFSVCAGSPRQVEIAPVRR
jgi:hypothetical protein